MFHFKYSWLSFCDMHKPHQSHWFSFNLKGNVYIFSVLSMSHIQGICFSVEKSNPVRVVVFKLPLEECGIIYLLC